MTEGHGVGNGETLTERRDVVDLIVTTDNIIQIVEKLKTELLYLSGRGVERIDVIYPARRGLNFWYGQCEETEGDRARDREGPPLPDALRKPHLAPGQCDEAADNGTRPFYRYQCDDPDDRLDWLCEHIRLVTWWLNVICRSVAKAR